MSGQETVCAVVVTYNRKGCLEHLLDALRSIAGLSVLVVDNASTDGTAGFLDARSGMSVLRLAENVGGAGGFAAGIRWGAAHGFAWLWLMDDDVLPLPGALETLRRHAAAATCVNPSKEKADGSIFEFEGRLDWSTLKRSRIPHAALAAAGRPVPCETACFEGLFVDAAFALKLVEPWEGFFIAWDDVLFGMLASKAGRNIYIPEVCIRKQFDVSHKGLGMTYHSSLRGRYFHLRNFCRVIAYVRRRRMGGSLAWFQLLREFAKALFLTAVVEHDVRGGWLLVLAVKHGVRNEMTAFLRHPALSGRP